MKYTYEYFLNLYDTVYQNGSFNKKDTLRRDRFKRIANNIPKKAKVLDFGGGDGDLFSFLNKKNIDYSIADLSKKHNLDSFKRISLKDGIYLSNILDNSYDIVVLSEVLEHIPNCFETLSEIGRVVKPKGKIIITVPNPFSFLFIVRSLFGLHLDKSKEHLYWFDWSYLSNLLLSCGFVLVSKNTFCFLPSRVYSKIYFLDKLFSRIFPNNCAQLLCIFKKR